MKFCRGSFWNTTVTWNTYHPHFTQCFEDTVFTGVPCLILWLGFPFWLRWICKQDQKILPPPQMRLYIWIIKLIGNLIANNIIFEIWSGGDYKKTILDIKSFQ